MNYNIRKRKKEDCAQIAHVVTIAWNETYKGLVPDEFLNNLYVNEEERANNTYNKFDENNNHQFVLEVDNKIVGFINVGENKEDYGSDCGEIHALYIINGYKGNGFGRKLVEEGINELKNMGFNKMLIGCLVGNPSNEFYKHLGGQLLKTTIYKQLNLPENIYYFDKI